jgi:thiazole synthase
MNYGNWIKIEVINDQKYLLPDSAETLLATQQLVKEGFVVLPYVYPDLSLARRLADAGAAAVMPLGAPIGSNAGLTTREQIAILIEEIDLPIIVDAGIGRPSHAAQAMELGAAAVLLNTAIASSPDPVAMAEAFYHAVVAGRKAFLAGLGPQLRQASASSPLTGFLD